MKRLVLCMTLMVVAFSAKAAQAQYQDIFYEIDPAHLTAEVSSNPRVVGDIIIPSSIVVGQETYTVTSIGDKAFKGCKSLTSIVLPPTLERAYRSAFDGTGIMADKTNWNEGCLFIDSILIATDKNIKSRYVVPASTRFIAAGAFQGNKVITRVELPEGRKRRPSGIARRCKR